MTAARFDSGDPRVDTALAELAAADPDTADRATDAFTGLTWTGLGVCRVAAGSRVTFRKLDSDGIKLGGRGFFTATSGRSRTYSSPCIVDSGGITTVGAGRSGRSPPPGGATGYPPTLGPGRRGRSDCGQGEPKWYCSSSRAQYACRASSTSWANE
jgi:hypothetical protein